MRPDQSDRTALYVGSVRRGAWRAQLLHEEMAEAAQRRRAAGKSRVVAAGFAIGALDGIHHFL